MSESKTDPSWLEQIENANAEQLDALRQQVPEGIERTYFDLKVGELKGIYHFGKSTVEGVIDLAKAGWKVATDPVTRQKFVDGAISIAEDYAKLQYGSREQKQEVAQCAWDKTKQVAQGVKQQMENQWEKAKHSGKQAELVADWGTCGILEIATMFIGLGELKVAAKTPEAAAAIAKVEQKVAEAGKLAKAKEVTLSSKVSAVTQECSVAKPTLELKVEVPPSVEAGEARGFVRDLSKAPPKGGSYGQLKKGYKNRGKEIHHIPADSQSPLPKNDGPAIVMAPADHRKTKSYDNLAGAREYMQQQGDLISQDKFREAMEMDIADIRSKFGTKYDSAISEAIDYAKTIGKW
jgi:hypothetical protein